MCEFLGSDQLGMGGLRVPAEEVGKGKWELRCEDVLSAGSALEGAFSQFAFKHCDNAGGSRI